MKPLMAQMQYHISMNPHVKNAEVTGGTAAVIGSLIGSFVGAKLMGNKAHSRLGSTAGLLVGSAMVSGATSSMVQALHQSSVEQVTYHQQWQAAMECGEEMPPLEKQNWQDIVGKMVNSIKETMMTVSSSTGNRNNNNSNGQNTPFHGMRTLSMMTTSHDRDGWKQTVETVMNVASKVKAQMEEQQTAASSNRQQSWQNYKL